MHELDEKKIIVSEATSLLNLAKTHSGGRVLLEFPQLTQREAAYWESRINAQRDDCGCSLGAKFLLVGAVLYCFSLWITPQDFLLDIWVRVLLGVPVALIAAGIGKGTGLFLARVKLQKTLTRLSFRLITQSEPEVQ